MQTGFVTDVVVAHMHVLCSDVHASFEWDTASQRSLHTEHRSYQIHTQAILLRRAGACGVPLQVISLNLPAEMPSRRQEKEDIDSRERIVDRIDDKAIAREDCAGKSKLPHGERAIKFMNEDDWGDW